MNELCAACKKPVAFEPAKCPYCTVVQPRRAHDPVRHRKLTLACGLAGAAAGLLAGFFLVGRQPPPGLSAAALEESRKVAAQERERLRARWSAERRALEAEGFTLPDPKTLAVTPEAFVSDKVALAGYATFVQVRPEGTRLSLGTRWAGGPNFEIDITGLPAKTQAALMRSSRRPSLVAVAGAWKALSPFFGGIHSTGNLGLWARRAVILGPTPRDATLPVEEALER